ncbi:MAG: hypothetical protein KGZ83_21835 [Sulfuricella sp.]|nr:hypothetical protein [Sulfuricella sp.]
MSKKLLLMVLAGLMLTIPPAQGGDTISVATTGYLAVGVAGQVITLPDIVITENWSGALRTSGFVALAAPYSQIDKFNVAGATLKAYRASDGAELTSTLIGNNQLLADTAPSATNVPDVVFSLAAASTAETGPIKLVISNLKAILAVTSVGDIILTIGGAETSGSTLDTLQIIDASLGAGATRLTLRVGAIVSACTIEPQPVVTGPLSAQTISVSMEASGSDRGKQGSIYVAAILHLGFNPSSVYFLNEIGAWEMFSSCATAPAYFTGVLQQSGNTVIPVVPTPIDLTAFKGTDIYVGYGIPGKMTACENMLDYGTYAKMYTIR